MKVAHIASRNAPTQDRKKLETLIHYISFKCTDPTKLGAIKLNKILWYSDVNAFLSTGKTISGARYIKRQHGPVPEGLVTARKNLQDAGAITVKQAAFCGYNQTQLIAHSKPDLANFDGNEISLVDEVIAHICNNHSAMSISDSTHDIVWDAAEIGEEIPIYAVYASRKGAITSDDVKWAKQQAKRLGLAAR